MELVFLREVKGSMMAALVFLGSGSELRFLRDSFLTGTYFLLGG
jgi:hypothetical protein